MQCNLIVIGLVFDILGFLMVFAFGGFNVGRSALLSEESKKMTLFKIIGAILVILGFLLQLIGAAYQS